MVFEIEKESKAGTISSERLITRRKIIKGSLVTAAALATNSNFNPAYAKKNKSIRIALPERLYGDTALIHLESGLKKIFGLSLEISYPLSPESTPLTALENGSAEMAYTSPCFEKALPDYFFFFSGIPFGMNNIELLSWIKQDQGQPLLEKSFSEMDLKAWIIRINGSSTGAWHKAALTNPEDYKKKKIIAHGLSRKVFEKMGSTIIDLPPEKSKALFEKNEIDAIEGLDPAESIEYGFERLDAIYYWPGWHTPCESFFLLMKKKEYEALPSSVKTGLDWLCYSSIAMSMSSTTHRNSTKTSILTAIPKLNVKRIPDHLLTDMAKVSQEIIESIGNKDPHSKIILDSYRKFFKEASSWTQLGDEAFSLARSLTLSYLESKKIK